MKSEFPEMIINQREIGENYPPYIIAEMSANHNGDINNAYKIIDMAKSSGYINFMKKLTLHGIGTRTYFNMLIILE